MDKILNNMKAMPFYKKDYYKSDQFRICDLEELVIEWSSLGNIRAKQKRETILLNNNYHDLLDHDDDFMLIANTFGDHANLDLIEILIGGIDFHVLKLILKAKKLKDTPESNQFYPLLDSHVQVCLKTCCNEVKRRGHIIDTHQKPEL